MVAQYCNFIELKAIIPRLVHMPTMPMILLMRMIMRLYSTIILCTRLGTRKTLSHGQRSLSRTAVLWARQPLVVRNRTSRWSSSRPLCDWRDVSFINEYQAIIIRDPWLTAIYFIGSWIDQLITATTPLRRDRLSPSLIVVVAVDQSPWLYFHSANINEEAIISMRRWIHLELCTTF